MFLQRSAALIHRRAGCVDVVNQQDPLAFNGVLGVQRKSGTNVSASLFFGELRLRRCLLVAPQHKRVHGNFVIAADLPRQKHGLVEAAPAQPFGVQGYGNDQADLALAEKFLTAARHELSQRFTKRDFPAVFEFLYHLAQRLLVEFFSGIAGPSSGAREVGRTRKADATDVIVSARVWKRPAANFAQRVGDELNIFFATRAKIHRVSSVYPAAACAATRRIEPVDDPIKTVGEGWSLRKLHKSHAP